MHREASRGIPNWISFISSILIDMRKDWLMTQFNFDCNECWCSNMTRMASTDYNEDTIRTDFSNITTQPANVAL